VTRHGSVSLVTGATGFLGSAVVACLAGRGEVVRCVVRGATDGERVARLRAALDGRAHGAWNQIEAVPGDLAVERLGLAGSDFSALGQHVDRIIHCGAKVNLALPYGPLHETNVRATGDLLSLAGSVGAAFGYVGSLAAVAQTVPDEPFELTAPVRGGYAQSKWAADRLVSVAHQEGRVRAVILRPGRVTADSRTARSNPDDLLERVIHLCAQLGSAPLLDTHVRLSPLDWVSRLIVDLSGRTASSGYAYHLISPETLPWSEVLRALRGAGYPVAELPYENWRSLVVAAGRNDPQIARVASSLRPDGLGFDDRPAIRPVQAVQALGGAYPGLPPAGLLLDRTIAAWQRTGILPPAPTRSTNLLSHAPGPARPQPVPRPADRQTRTRR
jgi:thioester reductase-like protein